MIYSPQEYSEKFLFQGKKVSAMTIKRRCEKGMLPSGHKARKLPGKTGGWIIEVPDIIPTKADPVKPDLKTINRKYFSFGK